jgi:hypothetical protein
MTLSISFFALASLSWAGSQGLAEEGHVNFLEFGALEGFREVVSVFEAFNLNPGALLTGQRMLGLLDFALKLAKSSETLGDIGTGSF